MSNPYGVSYAVISGQKNAGEVVVAASTILLMDWQSITPVSANKNVRKEFLLAIDAFSWREKYAIAYSKQEEFAEKIIEPGGNLFMGNEFWLALDEQGDSIARDILSANGESPDKTVHKSIRKLNSIGQTLPPPEINTSADFWTKIIVGLIRLSHEHYETKSKDTYQSFVNSRLPMTPLENEYYSWFKSLYENLVPWRKTIRGFQSDLS
jgi:hypothetical protein